MDSMHREHLREEREAEREAWVIGWMACHIRMTGATGPEWEAWHRTEAERAWEEKRRG